MYHDIWKQEESKSEQQRDEVLNTSSVGVTEAIYLSLFWFFFGGGVLFGFVWLVGFGVVFFVWLVLVFCLFFNGGAAFFKYGEES